MTGNDVRHAALLLVHRAPAIHRRPYYPPPLGHSSHTGSYEADGVGSYFYGCDKNVIKDRQPSVSCQRPGSPCPPLRSHVS